MNIMIEQLRRLPVRRTDECWEVAAAPVLTVVDPERGGFPEQAAACICVSNHGGLSMADIQTVNEFSPNAGLDALQRFALTPHQPDVQPLNYLPGRVVIGPMPEEAQRTLAEALAETGVVVEVHDDVPVARRALEELTQYLAERDDDLGGERVKAPALARVQGMTVERIAAFAEAAGRFWEARPWELFTELDEDILWRIDPKPGTRSLSHVFVMGAGDVEFGLAFFTGPEQMDEVSAAAHPSEYFSGSSTTCWSVLFDQVNHIPLHDAKLWKKHGLPVAARDAYPLPIGVKSNGKLLRPTTLNLTLMEGLLRAFTTLTPDEISKGEFSRSVPTFGAPMTLTLRNVSTQ